MKKNIYRVLLIIVSLIVAGCSNAEDIKHPIILQNTNKDVTSSQPQSLQTSQSKLNCTQFNLDEIDNMVCAYWKDSKKFREAIKIQDYKTYPSIIEVNELSPVEYNFFTTTEIKLST